MGISLVANDIHRLPQTSRGPPYAHAPGQFVAAQEGKTFVLVMILPQKNRDN